MEHEVLITKKQKQIVAAKTFKRSYEMEFSNPPIGKWQILELCSLQCSVLCDINLVILY